MKRFYPFILLLCLAFVGGSDRLQHNDHNLLTWDDFKGRPDRSSPYFANTASGFEFEMELKGDSIIIFLPCYFEKKGSWVKKGQGTAALLAHEQLHFDITELHVRKMRQAFINLGSVSLKTVNKNAEKIIKEFSKESSKRQNQYDKETNHSIKVQQQVEWEKQIETEMNELNNFAQPRIALLINQQ